VKKKKKKKSEYDDDSDSEDEDGQKKKSLREEVRRQAHASVSGSRKCFELLLGKVAYW